MALGFPSLDMGTNEKKCFYNSLSSGHITDNCPSDGGYLYEMKGIGLIAGNRTTARAFFADTGYSRSEQNPLVTMEFLN